MENSFARRPKRPSEDPYLFPRATLVTRLCRTSVREDDPRWAALERATMHSDPLGDAVAEWLSEHPEGRRLLDDLLDHGSDRADVPEPLAKLFAAVEQVPAWLDREHVALGTSTMLRMADPGQLALTVMSLLAGYLSSTVNKPLRFTGQLASRAPRRLAETGHFIRDIATSEQLDRGSPGFKSAVRVRLMHAMVRRRLSAMPSWQLDPWGVPINQRDMVATHLQFTVAYIVGLTLIGALMTPCEVDALMHTWRYVSYLLGADDSLIPKSFREGLELVEIYNRTEPGPDQDSLELGKALRASWEEGSPAHVASFITGFARYALGERASRQLGVPDTPWKHAAPALAATLLLPALAVASVPRARSLAVRKGKAFLNDRVDSVLAGVPASFIPATP